MSPKTKLSLLEIEQEVEAQAREWHRQQLQKRLQQVAEEQGAVCPLTGEPLQDVKGEVEKYEVIGDICSVGGRRSAWNWRGRRSNPPARGASWLGQRAVPSLSGIPGGF